MYNLIYQSFWRLFGSFGNSTAKKRYVDQSDELEDYYMFEIFYLTEDLCGKNTAKYYSTAINAKNKSK